VFPVRYGLHLYIAFRRNSVFRGLKQFNETGSACDGRVNRRKLSVLLIHETDCTVICGW
jgi:hypothetical protein